MPSCAVRTFTDPDDYAAAIRQGTYELTVTARAFHRETHSDRSASALDAAVLRYLPRISHIAGWGGRAVIAFRTEPGPSLLPSGIEMQPTNIVRYIEGQNYHRRSSGFAAYGSMSLPLAGMAAFGEASAEVDLTPPRDVMLITPLPAPMARLQPLHAAAGDLAKRAPDIIANPDAARGLEQALTEALVGCVASREDRESSVAGPKRYLLLRRKHLVQRALRDAARATMSVTEIATRYGFWQLGRLPSNTIRYSASPHPPRIGANSVNPNICLPKLHNRPRDRTPKLRFSGARIVASSLSRTIRARAE